MTQNNAMELSDYIAIFTKRKLPFFVTASIVFAIGVVVAFALPPVYRSEATIIIERQEIPQDLVATTVTGYVQERIEGIRQRLVTHENILDIAQQLNLYPELRANAQTSEIVKRVRSSISVNMVDIKTGGSRNTATVAFTVGFEASTAQIAQLVASELADRYLAVNKQARSEQAFQVSQFLDQEAGRLQVEITALEKKLAVFKQKQSTQLPEMLQMNMRLYEKTEGQIEGTKDKLQGIEDQIVAIQSELSLTNPYKSVRTQSGLVVQSPAERLNSLISEYLTSSVRYAENHPDMVRLRREIQSLGNQSGGAKVSGLVSKITLLRAQLLEANQKYSSDHPDVRNLEKSLAKLSNELRITNIASEANGSDFDAPPDNPRFVSLKTRLDTLKSNLKIEQAKLEKYTIKLHEYEARVFKTPVVERDYQTLTRDYGNAKKKYTELRNKQLEARLAEQLEAGDKGERFVLAGKAFLPSRPDRPNRLGIVLLAGLLSLMGGVMALAVAEFRDDSINGMRGVKEVYGSLPIVIIPYIPNSSDFSERKKRFFKILAVIVFIAGMAIFILNTYFAPGVLPHTVKG